MLSIPSLHPGYSESNPPDWLPHEQVKVPPAVSVINVNSAQWKAALANSEIFKITFLVKIFHWTSLQGHQDQVSSGVWGGFRRDQGVDRRQDPLHGRRQDQHVWGGEDDHGDDVCDYGDNDVDDNDKISILKWRDDVLWWRHQDLTFRSVDFQLSESHNFLEWKHLPLKSFKWIRISVEWSGEYLRQFQKIGSNKFYHYYHTPKRNEASIEIHHKHKTDPPLISR